MRKNQRRLTEEEKAWLLEVRVLLKEGLHQHGDLARRLNMSTSGVWEKLARLDRYIEKHGRLRLRRRHDAELVA